MVKTGATTSTCINIDPGNYFRIISAYKVELSRRTLSSSTHQPLLLAKQHKIPSANQSEKTDRTEMFQSKRNKWTDSGKRKKKNPQRITGAYSFLEAN